MVGRILRERGRIGELAAEIYSSQPGRAEKLKDVMLGLGGLKRPVQVERLWYHNGRPVFKFFGIDSISDAQSWRGADLLAPESERARLEPGEYSHADLIGCEVRASLGEQPLGIVRGIEDYGSQILLRVEKSAGGEMLIPFVKAICREIDVARKIIRVELPEGLSGAVREARFVTFHVLTIFPEFFRGPFEHGVIERAQKAGLIQIRVHDLRTWTADRHRTVDDRPFGGGEGMVLKPGPIFEAVESIWPDRTEGEQGRKVVLLSAQGRKFDQSVAREFAGLSELLLICGRYEGVDERVAEHLADEELSVGDFVLSGGELAAAMVIDVVARLKEGVLGNRDSAVYESFGEDGLLDCPQYTRPAEFRGWKAPEVLLGGNHEEIRQWRRKAAREKTARHRPDLLRM